jgi:hypothetical protein
MSSDLLPFYKFLLLFILLLFSLTKYTLHGLSQAASGMILQNNRRL